MNLIESQAKQYQRAADLLNRYNERAKVMQNLRKQGFDKQADIVDKELTGIDKEFKEVRSKLLTEDFGTGIIVQREDMVTIAEKFEYHFPPA